MSAAIGTIVKVGGSLWDLPNLASRLQYWLEVQADTLPKPLVLVAGLGPLGDTIRQWQAQFGWADERSHAMCLQLLDVAATALQQLLPAVASGDDWATLSTFDPTLLFILRPTRWLRQAEPYAPGSILPHNWDCTTDSIAARIAEVSGANQLVLLKSKSPTTNDWVAEGYVDAHFNTAAANIAHVLCVNFRDAPTRFTEQPNHCN